MRRAAAWVAVAASAALAGAPRAQAKDAEGTVRKTEQGLHFQVPEDWPVERRAGVVTPVPIEEYLARKFKTLDAAVQGLEQRVSGLDLQVRVLQDEVKKTREGLRSAEAAKEP